jgi:hypothetical protein
MPVFFEAVQTNPAREYAAGFGTALVVIRTPHFCGIFHQVRFSSISLTELFQNQGIFKDSQHNFPRVRNPGGSSVQSISELLKIAGQPTFPPDTVPVSIVEKNTKKKDSFLILPSLLLLGILHQSSNTQD